MRDIKGYEGLYAITSCGRVWSYRNQKFLVPFNKDHYPKVQLAVNGITKIRSIHQLVAEAYIPNPENKPTVNHIDENTSHNWISNLQWMTYKENASYGTRCERIWKTRRKIKTIGGQ